MNKCLPVLLLVGILSLAGIGNPIHPAQGSPADNEPPVRLKKKGPNSDAKPRIEPGQSEEKKKDDLPEASPAEKKPELREAEPVTPQEEEKEILQRVVANVHRVNERLAKNDLGEATQQTQRDILKDLESLLQRNENPPQGGGQADQNHTGHRGNNPDKTNQQQSRDQQNQRSQGRSQQSRSQAKGDSQRQAGEGGQSGTRASGGPKSGAPQQLPRGGAKISSEKSVGKNDKDTLKSGGKNGKNGNGSGGGDRDDRVRNKNADLDKQGVWGHLPQTLRPQMDAYSNPQPFIPKYDDLIKRYYRTIAEQGRRKGD